MPTAREKCVNYAINIQMCPCTSETCANRGICCECVQAHSAKGSLVSCMRGTQRDPKTLGLAARAVKCQANLQRNLDFCPCDYQPCDNKGTCCSCVRNHFKADGTGRVACMRAS